MIFFDPSRHSNGRTPQKSRFFVVFYKKNIFLIFFQKPIAISKKVCYNMQVNRQGPLVKRLRRRPLTAKAWVRFPYGSPKREAPPQTWGCFSFCRSRARDRDGVCRKEQSLLFFAKAHAWVRKTPWGASSLLVSGKVFSFAQRANVRTGHLERGSLYV